MKSDSPEKCAPAARVFVVGMNGSGTTMLLDHLGNHSSIFGFPDETKSLPYFILNSRRYGNLADELNFRRLRDEVVNAIGKAGIDAALQLDWSTVDRSAAGVFDAIMKKLAKSHGKRVWCEKTPMHVHHMRLLGAHFPDARFIHVIRDGRDCAASFHRRWRFNPVRTMYRWKQAVDAGQRQGADLGNRYLEVRYERVTEAPEAEFGAILQFLGLPFESSVLRSMRARPNATTPAHGQVVRSDRGAAVYFKPSVIAAMEAVAGKTLARLGYSCSNPDGDSDPGAVQRRWWQLSDDLQRLSTFLTRNGRLLRPSQWRYLVTRLRSSLRQKASL
jgi:hypothetical protein